MLEDIIKKIDSVKEQVKELPAFEDNIGYMDYEKIPLKIWYCLDAAKDGSINERSPAEWMLTPNYSGSAERNTGYSVSIWLWEGIPEKFKPIVFYHELKEAEFVLAGKKNKEAHQNAIIWHMAYAKKYLSKDEFQNFLNWQIQMSEL